MRYASAAGKGGFDIRRSGEYKERQHLATLDYLVEFKPENSLRITADYLNQYSKDNSLATENSIGSEKRTFWIFKGNTTSTRF